MKVFLIHNRYQTYGGEDSVFAAESALLQARGHSVAEHLEDNRDLHNVSPLRAACNTIWSQGSRKRLEDLLRSARPDVAHFHNTFLKISPAGYYACRAANVPVVQTLHNYRLLCPTATFYRQGQICEECLGRTPPWPGVLHACYRASRSKTAVVAAMLTVHRWLGTWHDNIDVYIALTHFARDRFIKGGLPAEKIVVKPNFVHPDPGERTEEGTYALFVGRLTAEKGVETILNAWAELGRIPLRIVGTGPLLPKVVSSVQEQGLAHVEILGEKPRSEVMMLMKAARFLVVPSRCYEGFPMTVAEAFACGVPVIASRLGALQEIVDDQRTGMLFKPGDAADLAAKVEGAWTEQKRTSALAQEARRDYERKYTPHANYEILMEIYTRAAERKL
jgi:glycosyltransferase involved in cell wall biosynthesis